ncbi:MAG: hypothetical protein JXA33_20705 [Anaerolineae bacterium]|nr:hypothetical protein [Anaerolineae bacterium]
MREHSTEWIKKMGMLCLYSTMVLLAVLLNACTKQTNFEYSLSTENIRTGSTVPLSIQVTDNSIEFALAFQGGGGENEAARLERNGQTLKVVLLNKDRMSQKILVLYRLSGTISNLESGSYALQIEDSTGRLITEESFDIP